MLSPRQLRRFVTGIGIVGIVVGFIGLVVGFAAGRWLVASGLLGAAYVMTIGGWVGRRRLSSLVKSGRERDSSLGPD